MAAAAGIDWAAWGAAAWGTAQRASTAGVAYLAGLPRNCYLASAHAAMVCAEIDTQYATIPGFGPIALGWGWLLLGMTSGIVLILAILAITGRMKQEPFIVQLAALMQPQRLPMAATSPMTSQAHADALRYVAMAGQPALRELAAAARMSESAFLCHLTGCALQSAPGLTIHQ